MRPSASSLPGSLYRDLKRLAAQKEWSLAETLRRAVFQDTSMARFAATGHLVVSRGGSLYAVPFDPGTLQTSGTPVSVVPGVGGDRTTGAAHVAWADSGTLTNVPGDIRGGMRQLVWSDLKGSRQSIDLPPAL